MYFSKDNIKVEEQTHQRILTLFDGDEVGPLLGANEGDILGDLEGMSVTGDLLGDEVGSDVGCW